MVQDTHYRTLDGFFEYYQDAITYMKERYGAIQHQYGLNALDQWLNDVEGITVSLLNKANDYGLTVNMALAPIAFMDDWIRYSFRFVHNWSSEHEEIWLPMHLFSITSFDGSNNPVQFTRVFLNDYVLEVQPEEMTAYSNDWYLILIRKKTKEGEERQPPIYEMSNSLSDGVAVTTQHPFILDEYIDRCMGPFDSLHKPYNDAYGTRTQLFVRACRIKNMSKHITVSGGLIRKYKNARIGYDESPGGTIPVESQKAILVNMLFSIPVVTSTFVIV